MHPWMQALAAVTRKQAMTQLPRIRVEALSGRAPHPHWIIGLKKHVIVCLRLYILAGSDSSTCTPKRIRRGSCVHRIRAIRHWRMGC